MSLGTLLTSPEDRVPFGQPPLCDDGLTRRLVSQIGQSAADLCEAALDGPGSVWRVGEAQDVDAGLEDAPGFRGELECHWGTLNEGSDA